MRLPIFTFPFLALMFGAAFLAPAWSGAIHASQENGLTADGKLDLPAIRKAYNESEFDWVKKVLESNLKHGNHLTREEKAFAYKYLGVIYASEADVKIRAESYFNLLLDLAPEVELVDMYTPKTIEDYFHKVKEDHASKAQYRQSHDSYGNRIAPESAKTTSTNPSTSSENNHHWLWWGGAGLVAVGVGTGVILWLDQPGTAKTDTIRGGF